MNSQLNQLLERARHYPEDPQVIADLARLYVTPQVGPDERAWIRAAMANSPALVITAHRWADALPLDDPNRYLRLQLLIHAITDGRPDSYNAGLHIEDLIKWAYRHGLDPAPHIEAVQRVASPTIATILHQRLLAWNRTRRFVDGQIAVLLETLSKSPADRDALESLALMYVHPDTSDPQRQSIRGLLESKPLLVEHYNRWQPSAMQDQPERFYRLMLGVVSMTQGAPDPQQAVQRVSQLRAFARRNRIDPDHGLEEICRLSSSRAVQVLRAARG